MSQALDLLQTQIDSLASPLGFVFTGAAETVDTVSAPEQTLMWKISFAVLAVIPLSSLELDELTAAENSAKEWMWRYVTSFERTGQLLDGYLLFALPKKPDPNSKIRAVIQGIELDTSVCRKHVIWPSDEDDWNEQLWGVTVLGLPQATRTIPTLLTMPPLPLLASRALQLYRETKNYESAAERLREDAQRRAEEDVK